VERIKAEEAAEEEHRQARMRELAEQARERREAEAAEERRRKDERDAKLRRYQDEKAKGEERLWPGTALDARGKPVAGPMSRSIRRGQKCGRRCCGGAPWTSIGGPVKRWPEAASAAFREGRQRDRANPSWWECDNREDHREILPQPPLSLLPPAASNTPCRRRPPAGMSRRGVSRLRSRVRHTKDSNYSFTTCNEAGTVSESVLYLTGHEIRFGASAYPGGYELRYSERGHPFYVYKKPVPRISDDILDCVIYLYPSVGDAEAGEKAGGTGFLVGVPSEVHEGVTYQYAVTNSHVIREGDSPVIRLNTQAGATDVLELSQDEWIHHQDGDDLAICPLEFSLDTHKSSLLTQDWFLTKEEMEAYDIGPGDDVFMVGRFIQHEGRQRNTPVVRFGNISMMPWEPVRNMRGLSKKASWWRCARLADSAGRPFSFTSRRLPCVLARERSKWLPTFGCWVWIGGTSQSTKRLGKAKGAKTLWRKDG
jgi:hypothetical protein